MTEKRFKVAVYDDKAINGFAVLDLHKPNSTKRLKYENVYIGSKEGCEIVCKFGNSLADENERLKQELYTCHTFLSSKTMLENRNEELAKENEQLKSEYKVLHTQYQDLKKFVENNFDEHSTQEKLNKQISKLSDENKQLKSQLYCDDEEGICNICKHHYLVSADEAELGYYNSRCKKGHYECARISLTHCEDFELICDME